MVSFWSFHIESLFVVSLVLMDSFRSFAVSLVSVVSFWPVRFVVSGFKPYF